jgi:hypothetical protein
VNWVPAAQFTAGPVSIQMDVRQDAEER